MDWIMVIGIVLLVAGFVLVGIEMVVPGFGAPGISGIICLVAGIFLTADTIEAGIFITVVVIVALGILMAVMLGLLSRKKFRSPIVLDEDLKEGSPISASDLEYLLKKEGTASTDLRPAGRATSRGLSWIFFRRGHILRREAGSLSAGSMRTD